MGLFDVWASWSDFLGDWWKGFKDKIWDIKNELWEWVDDIAKYWVERADMFFDILKHTWSEVEDLMEQAKSYADDIVTDAILKIDTWIQTFGESVAELWNKLEPYFSSVITPIENALDTIQNIKIPSLEDVTNWAKEQLDNILNWDLPILNQSVSDLWKETNEIWDEIWNNIWTSLNNAWEDINNIWKTFAEIPADVWNAITEGWEGLCDFLLSQGEKFVEKILDIDLPVDDIIRELEEKIKGEKK
ncbi:MAG: hypothetical protein QIT45_gp12 [Methanophagales virus PBV266]|uniref:Uncharacterized protein n=1 Tax=Methanophagales virus PBV266 TaxID=3071308 RepID=A0AA46TDS3_9VIRU|nr:MAG: hypothetical protein QIT45_gp12 [Methanophagales virus PBV266]UYL65025.1 MAG: hypothetical protein BDLDGNHF_00012 [Methanophagales virus PBV266]